MQIVIFDLDGTLADINHRRSCLDLAPPDWKTFNALMGDDTTNKPIVDLYRLIWGSGKYQMVIVSGRSEEFRKFTEQWLSWNEISFSTLFMRSKNDTRADYLVKQEILDQILSSGSEVAFVVDDRQQVVDMWRRNGITCLQCDTGNF